MAETQKPTQMKKTTIELTAEQYFFLKEKALELQKHHQNASLVSVIRDLIEKDKQEWNTRRIRVGVLEDLTNKM